LPAFSQSDVRNKMTTKLSSVSSEDLMLRIAEGDEYAFEVLVGRHQPSVLNLVYRYVGDRAEAKDLAQEVFVRVWQAAKSYQPKAKFSTWIYRIAVNLCLNELKSVKGKKLVRREAAEEERQGASCGTRGDISPSPEDRLLAEERSRQISEALQGLPENQRMALILRRYDNHSYQEIARIMGCSVSAVESLLVRAKRNVQEKLILSER
jgi:RNA polymerase sigma-70 factor (ECF subfamily)